MSVAMAVLIVFPSLTHAQRADSTRAGVKQPVQTASANSTAKRMVSPRRAFLTALIVPGFMQVRLGRPKAATIFLAAEAATAAMSVKSWRDLEKAKDARNDTVGTITLGTNGLPVIDSATGKPAVTYAPRNPNLVGRIRARRTHLEDWLAGIVFNHLFAGADAFVASNLQDFKDNVEVTSTGRSTTIVARVAW